MDHIKQSIAWWCFTQGDMTIERMVRLAADIGYQAIELVEQEHWQFIKDHGLAIASLRGQSSIEEGFNRREHHDRLEREVRANIALAAQWGIPNVIVFSGNREGLDDRRGAEITAEGLKRVARVAEDEGVTLFTICRSWKAISYARFANIMTILPFITRPEILVVRNSTRDRNCSISQLYRLLRRPAIKDISGRSSSRLGIQKLLSGGPSRSAIFVRHE